MTKAACIEPAQLLCETHITALLAHAGPVAQRSEQGTHNPEMGRRHQPAAMRRLAQLSSWRRFLFSCKIASTGTGGHSFANRTDTKTDTNSWQVSAYISGHRSTQKAGSLAVDLPLRTKFLLFLPAPIGCLASMLCVTLEMTAQTTL
jgi:hypothetical protein